MENFKSVEIVDDSRRKVTIGAGVTYTDLMEFLVNEGLAIDNTAALPHISIVGSIMTGTHGSGIHNKAMSNFVSEVAFVDPKGNLKRLSKAKDAEEFKIFLHSFGALGIVYEMKIDVRDEYALTKCIYADVPMDIIRNEENFNWLNYGYDFVAYFTDWKSDKFNTLYLGDRI